MPPFLFFFPQKVLKSAVPELVADIPVPGFLKRLFRAQNKLVSGLNEIIENQKDLIQVMVLYRHTGRIIYYCDVESPPVLLRDKGFFYSPCGEKKKKPQQELLRSIQYEKQSISTLAEMHNFLVGNGCGPGLAYTIAS